MKKIIALIFVAIMIISLAACDNDTPNDNNNQDHTHLFEEWQTTKKQLAPRTVLRLDIALAVKCKLRPFQL